METNAAIERLGALAQEARLRVFRLLVRAGHEGQPAGELARTLDCAPQTLSFHLKHLVSAGLIQSRREGRSIIYSLRTESVKELLSFLTEDCCQGRRELCVPIGASPRTKARQADAEARPSVLFVCSKNSARSQMAEALLRHRAGEQFDIRSAGIRPATVHPLAVRAMDELGIDMSSQRAQDLGAVMSGPVNDTAIVVCQQAQQDCGRIYPFALKRLYWPFEDPAACDGTEEERLDKFREVRDAIDARIQEWLEAGEHNRAQA